MFYKGSYSLTCHQTLAIPANTLQPQSITAIWKVLIVPTLNGGMARLSCGRRAVIISEVELLVLALCG